MQDSLSPELIRANLKTSFIGQNIIYYPRLTSTMIAAREEARQGAPEWTAVIAGEQTAGRGRLERAWLSPEGCIAVSIVLRPKLIQLPSLIMITSLAVVHTIKKITGLESQVKWPNDVLINGKKVCGILIVNDVRKGKISHAVIGIGINVNQRLADYPEIQRLATSLSDELSRNISRLDIIRTLFMELESLYLALQAGGSVFEEWRANLVTIGRQVRVGMGEIIHEGIAESVATDGSLLLRKSDGSLVKIVAGDITLRPATGSQ